MGRDPQEPLTPGLVRLTFNQIESIDEAVLRGCELEECRPLLELDSRIRREIIGLTSFYGVRFAELASACGSPIEQLLAIYLEHYHHVVHICDGDCVIHQQHEIETASGAFRVDFLIAGREAGVIASLIIECDGHDFHEKTKEQAARDKRRDRALKLVGYDVIRFTGSEIWNDPWECASEVGRQFRAILEREGRPNE